MNYNKPPIPMIAIPFGSDVPAGYIEIMRDKKPEFGIKYAVPLNNKEYSYRKELK